MAKKRRDSDDMPKNSILSTNRQASTMMELVDVLLVEVIKFVSRHAHMKYELIDLLGLGI
ncbi:hypothetical protein DEO72_LG9g460 [Vigna unguiculata]|uniref:Uncharacterized protein n=1 Tax=Vigna unguiculata TaxID=3917 RepID=A0A4D6N061_VIGUN|nr:hypothetical protein DEO72_LG9g460 [Vigna unguiculata]